MIKENVISFDFDGTISDHFGGNEKNPHQKEVRDFIFRLIRRGYDVYIITRRYGPENSNLGLINEHVDVWKTAAELGIPKDRVIFTNREWKYATIESVGACMHIDDDEREKYWIERHLPEVNMVWLGHNNWAEQIIYIIDEHDKLGIWIKNESNLLRIGVALIIILFMFFLFS